MILALWWVDVELCDIFLKKIWFIRGCCHFQTEMHCANTTLHGSCWQLHMFSTSMTWYFEKPTTAQAPRSSKQTTGMNFLIDIVWSAATSAISSRGTGLIFEEEVPSSTSFSSSVLVSSYIGGSCMRSMMWKIRFLSMVTNFLNTLSRFWMSIFKVLNWASAILINVLHVSMKVFSSFFEALIMSPPSRSFFNASPTFLPCSLLVGGKLQNVETKRGYFE